MEGSKGFLPRTPPPLSCSLSSGTSHSVFRTDGAGRDRSLQPQNIRPPGRLATTGHQQTHTSLRELILGSTSSLARCYVSCCVEGACSLYPNCQWGLLPFSPPHSGAEALHLICLLAQATLDTLYPSCVGLAGVGETKQVGSPTAAIPKPLHPTESQGLEHSP